jgi:hypothetical protein
MNKEKSIMAYIRKNSTKRILGGLSARPALIPIKNMTRKKAWYIQSFLRHIRQYENQISFLVLLYFIVISISQL